MRIEDPDDATCRNPSPNPQSAGANSPDFATIPQPRHLGIKQDCFVA
jgi:hypothetical protein